MKKILLLLLFLTLTACSTPEETSAPDVPSLSLPTAELPVPTMPPNAEQTPPTPEPTPEILPAAYELTAKTSLTLSDGSTAEKLLDADYETNYALGSSSTVKLSCEEEVFGLYVIWDLPPGEWSAGEQIFGKNGYIHEYVRLAQGAAELTLNMPSDGATICDIYTFSYGYPPDWVQTWTEPYDEADMLLIPTHADDEHLFFGGIMPYYAGELGYKVQVAYLTNHWNEPPRPHELLNGLWTVGITAYPVISGFNDKYAGSLAEAKNIYSYDEVLDFLIGLLERFKPLVVVDHDINGEYGHGVHILNAHAIQDAVDMAAEQGVWDTPKLYLHLWPENEIIMNWDIPLEHFDGKTAYEMAVAGYDCHKSQHQWAFAVRQAGDPYDCRRFGLVRSTVGSDEAKDDLFENVTLRGCCKTIERIASNSPGF